MNKNYKYLLTEKNIRDNFTYFSQALSKHQPTMQQLAEAFKRASNLIKESK